MARNIKVKLKKGKKETSVKKEIFIPENSEPVDREEGIKREVIIPEKIFEEKNESTILQNDVFSFTPNYSDADLSESVPVRVEDEQKKRKNIIFCFTDQQRYDTFNEDIMPNLTALAQEGITFDNCFTCQPVCGPARACLQTGVYATQTGCFKNGVALPEECDTLADYFSQAGYDTAYIGKWHLASDKDNNYQKTAIPRERLAGYDYFRGADILEFTSRGYDGYVFDENGNRIDFKGYRADCISDFALEYIDKRNRDNPFFMFISFLEPHHQNDRRHFEGFAPTVPHFKNYPIPEELKMFRGNYEREYPDYLSAINRVDYNIGLLIRKLKENGIYEDTVIIFSSDHGCHFKTRNAEYKRSCHDSSTHIPLVIRGGDFRGGLIDKRMVSLLDLPATMLACADIHIPEHYQGIDLAGDRRRNGVYVQISESECSRAIRTKEYLYSVAVPSYAAGMTMDSSPVYVEEYLYDIENDPMQLKNLIKAPDYKIVRSAMKKLLLAEMEEAEGTKAVILPAVTAKKK